ncbi:MAG: glycosyltransferase [Deltaproteobacteria bacterium]|nr:glycosyltransferase [Deltaproteobacteria bacterium]
MKITIAVHHFPPNFRGGAELLAYRSARELQKRGWQVDVVCIEHIDRGPVNAVAWRDDECDGLPVHRLDFDLAAAADPWRWSYDNPWIGEHLETWWKANRPDVVLLIGGYLLTASVLFAARRLSIPAAVRLTDFWFLCPRITLLRSDGSLSKPPIDPVRCAQCLGEESRRYRVSGQLFPAWMRRYWRTRTAAADRIRSRTQLLREALDIPRVLITESAFLRDVFVDAGVSASRFVQIRQGTDPIFVPGPEPSPSRLLRVGYFGQLIPAKGVHVLIDAVHRQPELALRLDLFGDTSRMPDYTLPLQRKTAADARVRWRGLLRDPRAIRDALHDLDVVCVPSVWYENSPNAILEALAAGVPVVTSNLGGMAELVQHGINGLLFPPGDATALGEQLRNLATTPGLSLRLRSGINPPKTTQNEVDELESILQSVARNDWGV